MTQKTSEAFDAAKAHVSPSAPWKVVVYDPITPLHLDAHNTMGIGHRAALVLVSCPDPALRNKLAAIIGNSLNKHCGGLT